ncbi:MAG: tetratricopeptide repeat protein [Nostoc sp.]|uniref:CHAT domain-containing tetratricopeptide repeat protein n=1 Tax=Nostoc sp. TaxID=1180 RepID=UPI002FFB27F3
MTNEQRQNDYLNLIRGILNSRSNWEFQKGQLQIFQQVLEMRQQGDRPSQTEALISMADSYNRLGKYTQAQELIEQTLAIVQQTSLQEQQHLQSFKAEALKLLGIVYFGQGNFTKAQETAQTALAMHKQLGDCIGEGATLIVVSAALIHLGQHSEAKEALEESLKALRKPSSSLDELKWRRFYEGEALAWMGDIEMISGNLEQAARTLEQALAVNRETGNRSYGELNTLYFIAALYSSQGELDKTLESCQQLLSLSQEIGHRFYEGIALISIGGVYQARIQDNQALASYQQALEVFQEIGDRQKEAETIVAIADIYAKQEQSQRLSLEHYQQALAIARDINNRPTEAKCLYSIGTIRNSLKQYPQAIKAYQEALAIFTEIKNLLGIEGDMAIAQLYTSIGQISSISGLYSEAQECFAQSLTLWQNLFVQVRENSNHETESLILFYLLIAYIASGQNCSAQQQYKQATDNFQKALDLARQLGNQEQEKGLVEQLVANYSNQGLAYAAHRDYEEALKSYQQSLKIAKENGLQSWEVNMLLCVGQIFTSRRYFTQALNYQKQALAIVKERNDHSMPTPIMLLFSLGTVYDKLFRYEEALKAYQQAYALAQPEDDRGLVANLLIGIGTIYANQKQYEQALNAYQQAQEATQNNPLAPFVNGINADNVEEFYLITQQCSSSIGISPLVDSCTDALAYYGSDGLKQSFFLDNINILAKKANQTFLTVKGGVLHAMGQLYLKQENYSQAFTYYQQALPILHEAEAVMEGATFSDLGIIYRLQGQYDQALECSQRGLEISRAFNHRINEKDALYFLAIVYWAKGDILSTLETLSQKAEVENETLALNLAIGSEERKRAYIAGQERSIDTIVTFHLQATPQNPKAAKLAFTTVLQRKGRILDVVLNNIQRLRQNLQAEDQTLFDDLNTAYTKLSKLLNPLLLNPFYKKQYNLSGEESKTQVAILKAKIEELEDTLAQRSIEFLTEVQPVTIEAVQALIPADAALVEFVRYLPFNPKTSRTSEAWGSPRYAVSILTYQENPKWIDLGEATPIDQAVIEFRDELRNQQNQLSDVQQRGQVFYNLLMSKVQVELSNIRHLLIAPDSQLNLVPFAALVNPQNQYLGDIYTISYLTSGRDLLRLQIERSDRPTHQVSMIIANPDKFPGMHIETEAIAPLLPNVLPLKDGQVIKETLKQYSPIILHIAAHGFFNQSNDNPTLNENPLLRCGLVLAGDNTDQRDNEKVVLTALEVTGLNLRGTRLVVLSACETGLGGVLDGEGVYGLRRAFVIAGAESQMVSLWNVDDLPTTFLIINFYDRLSHQHSYPNLEAGSVAIALNQAQLWLKNLTKRDLEKWIEEKQLPLDPTMRMNLRRRLYKLEDDAKPFKSPFYWAAFCAISQ